jgi:hypothetical protein
MAIRAGRAASRVSQLLRHGDGTTISGRVGLLVQRSLVADLGGELAQGSVVVTGTNGKTTTSLLIREWARRLGLLTLANASSSNIFIGLAATLLLAAPERNASPESMRLLGVFEVDEGTLPMALSHLQPSVVVIPISLTTSSGATAA